MIEIDVIVVVEVENATEPENIKNHPNKGWCLSNNEGDQHRDQHDIDLPLLCYLKIESMR